MAVSIYDDIDPGVKKETGPVDLYGQLHIPAPSGPPKGMLNTQPAPTVTTTTAYGQHHIAAQRQMPPTHQAPRTNTHNLSVNRNHGKPSQPTIINHPPSQMYPPTNAPPVDAALTGIPAAHQATFRSHVLYVGGLSWWVSDADLRHVFEQFGDITEIKVHADKVNGKSKGYGYIEYAQRDIEGAMSAKQKLHGHVVADCRICVAFASPERAKGAEYTNTPVHIPRGRKPMHHHNNGHPNLNHMNRGPHNLHSPAIRIGPATVIPTPQIGIQNALSTVTASHLIGGHQPRGVRGNPPVAATAASGTTAGNPPPNAAAGGAVTIKTEKPTAAALSGAANILSKFTNQSQLLALLSKANGANRSRSASRSPSGSRSSRSRSRDRSKHRRRRHHKKGGRTSGSSAERRNRDRDRERDRHRSDRGRGSGSDRGRDRGAERTRVDSSHSTHSRDERKDREGRETREGRDSGREREHRDRRRRDLEEKNGDGVVEDAADREKRRHKRRHRHHRERGDRDRHHRERGDRSRRRRSDGSGNEDDDIPVTTTSNVTDGARVSHERAD